jgi:hypothetical protein
MILSNLIDIIERASWSWGIVINEKNEINYFKIGSAT